MSIIHYNNDLFLFAVRHNAVFFKLKLFSPDWQKEPKRTDGHGEFVTVFSTGNTWSVEATTKMRRGRDGRRRQIMLRMRRKAGKKRRWKVTDANVMKMTVREGGQVQEVSYDNSVDCCYAMPDYYPVLQLLREGRGGRLQVDELVHQQQGASQAGQAGFRAATVTARVASWNWPQTKSTQKDKGRGGRAGGGKTSTDKQRRGGAEESQRAKKQSKREKRLKMKEFTLLMLQLFKHN